MTTQPWQIADLSLAELLKQGKAVERAHCNGELRLGILGDGATQHYSQCLAAALKLRGIWPETYQGVYEKQWLKQFIEGVLASDSIEPALYRDFHRDRRTRGVVRAMKRQP